MYLEIKVPKKIKVNTLTKLMKELDGWVINYDFNPKKELIRILTIPNNKQVITDLVEKFAKIFSEQRI